MEQGTTNEGLQIKQKKDHKSKKLGISYVLGLFHLHGVASLWMCKENVSAHSFSTSNTFNLLRGRRVLNLNVEDK